MRGEAPRAATTQDAYARYEQRRVELAGQRDALAADTTTVSTGGPADTMTGQTDDLRGRLGVYRALELWSPVSGRPDMFERHTDREMLLSRKTVERYQRTELGMRFPTPGDAYGDGLPDPRPVSQREEGNAGDRFAGELCGIGESVSFGLLKGPACSLGDSSTQGYQQGRNLGNFAAILAPDPSNRVTRAIPGARGSGPRASQPSSPPTQPRPHGNPPTPPPRAGGQPSSGEPHGAPSPPPRAQPRTRSGNRSSRTEREAEPERVPTRPSQDDETVLYRFDQHRPLELGPGQQGLDLPRTSDACRRTRHSGAVPPEHGSVARGDAQPQADPRARPCLPQGLRWQRHLHAS